MHGSAQLGAVIASLCSAFESRIRTGQRGNYLRNKQNQQFSTTTEGNSSNELPREIVIVIPARYGSTRLPGKPLVPSPALP